MEVEKSQEEVWEWKEKVYEEIRHLPPQKIKDFFNNLGSNLSKKYNLKLLVPRSFAETR